MNPAEFLLAFVAITAGLGTGALAIVMGIRHDRQKREWEHIERMKAFELGRTLPQDEPWFSPAKIGFAIATAVPGSSFTFAWLATESVGYHEPIWIGAMMVGIASVICGSILVASANKKRTVPRGAVSPKPYVEEDAYDVVSARG